MRGSGAFGSERVDRAGDFMDYDGDRQNGDGDVTSRGMLIEERGCPLTRRFYVDVYPSLELSSLGSARRARPDESHGC